MWIFYTTHKILPHRRLGCHFIVFTVLICDQYLQPFYRSSSRTTFKANEDRHLTLHRDVNILQTTVKLLIFTMQNKTKGNTKYNLLHEHILFILKIVNSQYFIKQHSNQQYTCSIGGQFYQNNIQCLLI